MTSVQDVARVVQPSADDCWRSAWTTALQAVEMDVEAAESLIERLHAGAEPPAELPAAQPWVTPGLLGPLPLEFADKARELVQRQLDVSSRLAEAMVQTRSQRRALGKLDPAESIPVFVDTRA